MTDSEKIDRNKKREEKRKIKDLKNVCNDYPSNNSNDYGEDNSIEKSSESRNSEVNSIVFGTSIIDNTEDLTTFFDVCHNGSLDRLELVAVDRPVMDYSNNLTENEGNRLTELIDASKVFTNRISSTTSEITTLSEALMTTAIKWDEEVRKIIKMANNLYAFNEICEEDKIVMLKYASCEIVLMRSVICYEKSTQNWNIFLV